MYNRKVYYGIIKPRLGGFMDQIKLLQTRRSKILAAGTETRKYIAELTDADSFVELSGFSFSKNDFYDEGAEGEGVITGFATIDGYPVYIAAQNGAVLSGGVSHANCQKLLRCLQLAEKNSTPIIYVLDSLGVQIGEGVNVLEGLAAVLSKASRLHGIVPQFAIVAGEVYGQSALLAAAADFTFFIKGSVLAANSPLVISAKSGKNLSKEQVGGAGALADTNLVASEEENIAAVREKIVKVLDILPFCNAAVVENGADLNASSPALNEGCTADALVEAVFDEGTAFCFGTGAPEVRCMLGRIGGISVAAVLFDKENGVELDAQNVAKIDSLVRFAGYFDLPFITFVNTLGLKADLVTNNSFALKQIYQLMEDYELLENAKIAVVYQKAIGLGYTLFAAKSMGFDYTYAFANAKIALFDDTQGAEIEFAGEKADKGKLAAKYAAENSDPIHAAKNGYVDNIIEPQFVRSYLIASLQMLLK